jgi:hypothetical protein
VDKQAERGGTNPRSHYRSIQDEAVAGLSEPEVGEASIVEVCWNDRIYNAVEGVSRLLQQEAK